MFERNRDRDREDRDELDREDNRDDEQQPRQQQQNATQGGQRPREYEATGKSRGGKMPSRGKKK